MNVNNHDITINTKSNLLFLALTIIPFVEYLDIISLPLRGCVAVAAAAWQRRRQSSGVGSAATAAAAAAAVWRWRRQRGGGGSWRCW